MKQAGRVHPFIVLGSFGAIVVGGLVAFSGESPSTAASRFMTALAKGDVDSLMKLSYSERSPEELRKQWEYSTQVAGKHYLFIWKVQSQLETGPNQASVRLQMTRNAMAPTSYEEPYALAMIKDHGTWKVDVKAIPRAIYPSLPH